MKEIDCYGDESDGISNVAGSGDELEGRVIQSITVGTIVAPTHNIQPSAGKPGIEIVGSSDSDFLVIAVRTGDYAILTTGGLSAHGISAEMEYAGPLRVVLLEESRINAAGRGISAVEMSIGDLRVDSAGTIVSNGVGLFASEHGEGDLTIVASESITASGAGSHAIHAREAGAGRLTLTSSGALVANGADAHGILVE
ncbi:MAG: hypothetical protein AAF732_24480, partial [Pseudomonadota bacterium]